MGLLLQTGKLSCVESCGIPNSDTVNTDGCRQSDETSDMIFEIDAIVHHDRLKRNRREGAGAANSDREI